MNNLRFESDDGNYKSAAHSFTMADDLYLFFKFESPKSNCEIAIAYDEYVDAGDWYVHDGNLGGCDYELVDDILFDRLPRSAEFKRFEMSVSEAVREFNGC